MTTSRAVWIGTYPAAGAGSLAGLGEGIWRVELGDLVAGAVGPSVGATLAVTTPAPSFLAAHPSGRVLYAVGEQAAGTVTAFAAGSDGRLGALSVVSSGGADPCHLLLAPDARTLYVTNYSSGSVGVLPLDADGAFTRATIVAGGPVQVLAHTGSGPDPERQEAPHAHSAAFAPGGRHLLVADLGTDELRRYRVLPDGSLEPDGVAATLPPGTGPRHLVAIADDAGRLPDGRIYLVGELDSTVRVLRWDGATATATLLQTLPATTTRATTEPPSVTQPPSLPAHLVLDADRLLVSIRGADVISTFAVDPRSGLLTAAGEVPTDGAWPRHFALLDGVCLVAHQHSGTVGTLVPRGADGQRRPGDRAAVVHQIPAPACILPA
ncbi:lactonase family protein [Pengzhenrongella phosphoraccumulans]|uniref:lactonase family protein n=1 Tax=Pengzhenrongella phosphoraccumulans TaxID=3114394 RepID=UPI00388DBBC5